MKKYEVGYEGEFLGIYYAETPEDAVRQCKSDVYMAKTFVLRVVKSAHFTATEVNY